MSKFVMPLLLTLSSTFASTALLAQVLPTIPPQRSQALLAADPDRDTVWRMIDWNQDGDFHDAGEIRAFYDDAIGSIALPGVTEVRQLGDGTVLAVDPAVYDRIIALRDLNGDGDANDAGEQWVWFDSYQLSGVGVHVTYMSGLVVDQQDRAFVCNSGSGNGDKDAVYLLQDLNGDGDALDFGEFREYAEICPWTASLYDSVPSHLLAASDGNLYYLDNGYAQPRGVYRLADLDHDGDCNDAGERQLCWAPPAGGTYPSLGALAVTPDNRFYLVSRGDYRIWTGFDVSGDGTIDAAEQSIFHSAVASTWTDIALDERGRLFVSEGLFPTAIRILVLDDADGSGSIDPGETSDWYNRQVSATALPNPQRATFERGPVLASPGTVARGQTAALSVHTAKSFDLCGVFLSVGLAPSPIQLAPWGVVEIDIAAFAPIGFGLADASARFQLPFAIPNVPTALGGYGLQALCGDGSRLFLSNAELLTVAP